MSICINIADEVVFCSSDPYLYIPRFADKLSKAETNSSNQNSDAIPQPKQPTSNSNILFFVYGHQMFPFSFLFEIYDYFSQTSLSGLTEHCLVQIQTIMISYNSRRRRYGTNSVLASMEAMYACMAPLAPWAARKLIKFIVLRQMGEKTLDPFSQLLSANKPLRSLSMKLVNGIYVRLETNLQDSWSPLLRSTQIQTKMPPRNPPKLANPSCSRHPI